MSRLDAIKQQAAQVADTGLDMSQPAPQWDETTHGFRIVIPALKERFGREWHQHLNTAYSSAEKYLSVHGSLNGWTPAGGGKTLGQQIAKLNRKQAEERRELFKAQGYKATHATAQQVQHAMRRAHDAAFDADRPSASALFREQGIDAKVATKLASRGSIHLGEAWQAQANHPSRLVMEEQQVLTRRKSNAARNGSIAGAVSTLYSLADHASDRQRITALETQQAKQAEELAELRRQLTHYKQATDQRVSAVEAATDWKAAALRLKAEGLNAKQIAERLDQKHDTVRKHLQRNG